MSETPFNPSTGGEPPRLTIAQAKANLLAHGEQAGREIDAMYERARADVHETVASVKRAVPWAAAAALGAGLFMGRSRKRRARRAEAGGASGGEPAGGTAGAAVSGVKWAVTTLGPFAMDWFLRARKAGAERRRDAE